MDKQQELLSLHINEKKKYHFSSNFLNVVTQNVTTYRQYYNSIT